MSVSDQPSQDTLRRRIQRIETLLHGRQAAHEQPQSISSALSGIEKLLGIPTPESETKNAILMPSLGDPITSPNTLPSPAGSASSQMRPAFLAEANHKRWGAESAIGQSWSKVVSLSDLSLTPDLCDGSAITNSFQYPRTSWCG